MSTHKFGVHLLNGHGFERYSFSHEHVSFECSTLIYNIDRYRNIYIDRYVYMHPTYIKYK